MNGLKIERCGMCQKRVGKGKGKLTGAEIKGFHATLADPKLPQLSGLPTIVDILICIECSTNISDTLHTATIKYKVIKPN